MIIVGFITLIIAFYVTSILARKKYKNLKIKPDTQRHLPSVKRGNRSNYFAYYIALWAFVPTLMIFLVGILGSNFFIKEIFLYSHVEHLSTFQKDVVVSQIIEISNLSFSDYDSIFISYIPKETAIALAQQYSAYKTIFTLLIMILGALVFICLAFVTIKKSTSNMDFQKKIEQFIKYILFCLTTVAVFTTVAIVLSLFFEALRFFKEVSILKFLFGTQWAPEDAEYDPQNSFGIIPLLVGTFLISFIAVLIAVIIGISSAIYMAEYMAKSLRKVIKPVLEILSGIPSIVYGFFAAITFAPFVVSTFSKIGIYVPSENALTAGVIMGVMIIPFISSISDDVFNSIPSAIREGAMGMGSMKNEMIRKIIIPAALPGITGGVLLAISRAIGETMIVVMASSLAANLTINPLEPVTTITTQIVMLVQGDQEFDSPKTLSAFALGFILLLLTLVINIIAIKIVNKYKKQYN